MGRVSCSSGASSPVATLQADSILALLRSSSAAEREQGYVLVEEIGRGSQDDMAVGMLVAPAFAALLSRDLSEIGYSEFQRASYLVMKIMLVDWRINATYLKHWQEPMQAAGNAISCCLDMRPEELTREELLTISSYLTVFAAVWAPGITQTLTSGVVGGVPSEQDVLMGQMTCRLLPLSTAASSDVQNLALARRALALLRAEVAELPTPVVIGLFGLVWVTQQNRPKICALLFEETLPVVVATLKRGAPTEWHNISKGGMLYGPLFGAVKDSAEAATVAGSRKVVPLLLSSGYLNVCVQMMETFEREQGPCADSDVMSFFYGVCWLLATIDFSGSPEAVAILRAAAKPMQYALQPEHNMIQCADLGGWGTTLVWMSILAANLFGREEDSPLEFTQEVIDGALVILTELHNPTSWGGG